MKYKFTKEQFEKAVKKSLSIAQVCRELGIVAVGGNYKTVHSKIKLWEIDISHFTGAAWNVGERYRPVKEKAPLSEICIENSTYTSSNSLKKRLYAENVKEAKCECCGITEWQDKPISLELDHINGINNDNRLENLRILCPNCHSQTHTFRGKNKESVTSKLREDNYNNKHLLKIEKIPKPKKERKVRILIPKNKCLVCDNLVKENRFKYCSYECSKAVMRQNVPTKEDIISAFKMYKNFLQVGNYFNVSDNAVRKWCMKYNILEEMKLLR